ncbi:MAG: transglutaminase domain-containing protein [Candidatus Cryptobacteroides sp.]
MTHFKKYLLTAFCAVVLCFLSACTDRTNDLENVIAGLPEYVQEGISEDDIAGLGDDEKKYLAFLYGSMPLPDMAGYPFGYWLENVRKTLEVRRNASWDIPEREFMHFVLPLRVNNEALDDFRTLYADELSARVKGMTAEQAAIEINHWCHEMATYTPSDARTLPPTGTIAAGLGRCGEESVLAVAALRAAGIPARQVYTPRWAHTDDNHAWVEVFVDGKWHFMGACEPEPVLDLAWFNAPVSRAMLLHTLAFGDYDGPEDVIRRTRSFTEINVIKSYIPTRRTTVKVVDKDGKPVEGAEVEFKIYNYAEFYTVARMMTGKDGIAGLDTGLGDMLVWAHKDDRFGVGKADGDMTEISLGYNIGDSFGLDFEIVPPVENPIPSKATAEELRQNALRLEYEDSLRNARLKGNAAVLDAFRKVHGGKNAEILLASLSAKDMGDVRADVLEDAINHCTGDFTAYRDCPRISYEPLLPFFKEIGDGLEAVSAREIFDWTIGNIKVDDKLNPQRIYMPPVAVWRCKMADSRSRDIFFVAACRSKGIEARIDGVTGKTQYREDGEWKDVKWSEEVVAASAQGTLKATYEPVEWLKNPLYYRHFTLSRIENGSASLLSFDEDGGAGWKELLSEAYPAEVGYYLLTSAIRKADGSVSAHLEFFNVAKDTETVVPLTLRQQRGDIAVIGNIDVENTIFPMGQTEPQTILSLTGRGYFTLALIKDFSEPSIHALRQLGSSAEVFNVWGRPLVVLGADGSACARMKGYLGDIEAVHYGTDPGNSIQKMVYDGCMQDSGMLPAVIIADSFGRVVYYSHGYNTSLSEQLKAVVNQL